MYAKWNAGAADRAANTFRRLMQALSDYRHPARPRSVTAIGTATNTIGTLQRATLEHPAPRLLSPTARPPNPCPSPAGPAYPTRLPIPRLIRFLRGSTVTPFPRIPPPVQSEQTRMTPRDEPPRPSTRRRKRKRRYRQTPAGGEAKRTAVLLHRL